MGWSMDPGPCFVYVPLEGDERLLEKLINVSVSIDGSLEMDS